MRYKTNDKGMLELGGVAADELAKRYGTPLYVMEKDKIDSAMTAFTSALNKHWGSRGLVCYASKAFCCKEIYRIATAHGMGIDVVSEGELETARAVGFDMSMVCHHGNNKSVSELNLSAESDVGRIVVDNLAELETLERICASKNKHMNILLRVKPGIEAHTHTFIATGRIDSKFGVALETGEALAAVCAALGTKHLTLKGIHCHIGSQILSVKPFEAAARVMIGFLAQIKAKTGVELEELNLGGGFGISYSEEETALTADAALGGICAAVRVACAEHGMREPFLIFEPGRAIVGAAGTTLYTIGIVKEIPGVRTYVAVDGGMTDNLRYALYRSRYEMIVAGKARQARTQRVTVAGRCCESGDLLGENIPLQPAEAGDLLAVLDTGAYNFSMFTQYNRVMRPPVVMVGKGKARIIVRGDCVADVLRGDK